MALMLSATTSCACQQISSLSSEKSAESAMRTICRKLLIPTGQWGGMAQADGYQDLPSFLIFIAGSETKAHSQNKNGNPAYGTTLARLIRKEKLGTVVTPGKCKNIKHHKAQGTDCQTWVWKPNKETLIKWWEANKPEPYKRNEEILQGFEPVNGAWTNIYNEPAFVYYPCPHCKKVHKQGERVWQAYQKNGNWGYFCAPFGEECQKEFEYLGEL